MYLPNVDVAPEVRLSSEWGLEDLRGREIGEQGLAKWPGLWLRYQTFWLLLPVRASSRNLGLVILTNYLQCG